MYKGSKLERSSRIGCTSLCPGTWGVVSQLPPQPSTLQHVWRSGRYVWFIRIWQSLLQVWVDLSETMSVCIKGKLHLSCALYPSYGETDALWKSDLVTPCGAQYSRNSLLIKPGYTREETSRAVRVYILSADGRHSGIFSSCIFSPNTILGQWFAGRRQTERESLCNCPGARKVQWLWGLVSSQAVLFYICLHYWACFIFSSSAHCSFISSFYVSGSRTVSSTGSRIQTFIKSDRNHLTQSSGKMVRICGFGMMVVFNCRGFLIFYISLQFSI